MQKIQRNRPFGLMFHPDESLAVFGICTVDNIMIFGYILDTFKGSYRAGKGSCGK